MFLVRPPHGLISSGKANPISASADRISWGVAGGLNCSSNAISFLINHFLVMKVPVYDSWSDELESLGSSRKQSNARELLEVLLQHAGHLAPCGCFACPILHQGLFGFEHEPKLFEQGRTIQRSVQPAY